MNSLATIANKMFREYTIKNIVINQYKSLQQSDTINDAIKVILSSQHRMIIIYDKNKIVGWISRNHIVKALQNNDEYGSLEKYMSKQIEYIDAQQTIENARKEMSNSDNPIKIVAENNQIIGIIDKENIDELLLFITAKKNYLHL